MDGGRYEKCLYDNFLNLKKLLPENKGQLTGTFLKRNLGGTGVQAGHN